ncbi:MAG TPA: hypothetical protein VFI65_28060 [Streptosporangiaceae bacterium]|nr:hypothetical protein [Streptosporangiaceae bacterium]
MATYTRRRQAGSGLLLMLLGAWGALIPFVGPYFGYAYTPDRAWTYTSGRFWLSVVPGAVAVLGGLLVLSVRTSAAGAFLAALGGAWFVIGQPVVAEVVANGSISAGSPVATSGAAFGPSTMHFLEGLGFFYGLGVVIVFIAARTLGAAAARVITPTYARNADEVAMAENDYPTQAYNRY